MLFARSLSLARGVRGLVRRCYKAPALNALEGDGKAMHGKLMQVNSVAVRGSGEYLSLNLTPHPSQHMQNTTRGPREEGESGEVEFSAPWLRCNCHCPECSQGYSGQKLFTPERLPVDVRVRGVEVVGEELHLDWGDHRGHIPLSHLHSYSYSGECLERRNRARKPPPCTSLHFYNYDDVTNREKNTFVELLRALNEFGIVIVRGVPQTDGALVGVGELIAPVQTTIYGLYSDVFAVEHPINVAYSNNDLPLHQDLVYYESPPGLQLLHCLKFDACVRGGRNMYADVFAICDEFKERYPHEFDVLCRVPATFQKVHYERSHPVHMVYQRPHIVLNAYGDVTAVNWAPAFEGPLQVPPDDVPPYYEAYRVFSSLINSPTRHLHHRMAPGDLSIFNNRRILHGRQAFQLQGGERHFQVAYVNIDEFESKVRVMGGVRGDGPHSKRVGNQNLL